MGAFRLPALWAAAVCASLCLPAAAASSWMSAQAQVPSPASAAAPQRKSAPPKAASASKEEAKPTWAELNPTQQQALGPLAGTWKTLSEGHKRKWIALSQNYAKMTPDEQALLRSRMTEWAALTPQQRTQARLNFGEAKKLPADDKKAKWEAYQALPPEEKRKLAAGAAAVKPPPPPTAAAVQPVPPQKLAKTPARKESAKTPRIAAATSAPSAQPTLPAPQPGAAPLPAH